MVVPGGGGSTTITTTNINQRNGSGSFGIGSGIVGIGSGGFESTKSRRTDSDC